MKSTVPLQAAQLNQPPEVEKEVVILLSDMVSYSGKTTDMRPTAIKNFMLEYHLNLKNITQSICGKEQQIESSAGDGAVAIFERKPGETKDKVCGLALSVALKMVYAMEKGTIPPTRIGLFSGHIIEAVLDGKTMRFGATFSVASRMEELCSHFGTRVLMDREMALWQTEHAEYLTSIGKVTPKNLIHPVHLFSVYKPGIHGCPEDVDRLELLNFIEKKNQAVELFCGNIRKNILPNFPLARQKLLKVQDLFIKMTGKKDQPTERVLEYIQTSPRPEKDFTQVGMKIWEQVPELLGIRLLNLSSALFEAMDQEFYHTLVVNTEWQRKFRLVWRKKGERIIQFQDSPDGIYFIDDGSVDILDEKDGLITTLAAGNVFGEMAYFSNDGQRSANVVANCDVVLRRISEEDLNTLPVIQKIFKKIAERRTNTD